MVSIAKDTCIGCGVCANLCPDTFEIGADGKAAVKDMKDAAGCAQQAADSCPVGAITA